MPKPLMPRPTDAEAQRLTDARATLRRYLSRARGQAFAPPGDNEIDALDTVLDWATRFDPREAYDVAIQKLDRIERMEIALDQIGLDFDESTGVFKQRVDVQGTERVPYLRRG